MEATSSSKTPVPICQQDCNHVVACLQQYISGTEGARDTIDHYRPTAGTVREDGSSYCDMGPLTLLASVTDRRTERDTKQNTNRAHSKHVAHKRLSVTRNDNHTEMASKFHIN